MNNFITKVIHGLNLQSKSLIKLNNYAQKVTFFYCFKFSTN
jgi:hypothetical protein